MPTYFGRKSLEAREPRELAWGLARVPRWNGVTVVPWSVLQHSLGAAMIAMGGKARPEVQLYALWHDIEETVTSDIPAPFKQPDQAAFGEALRAEMYRAALGTPFPGDAVIEAVHGYDARMRNAEAHALLHPRYTAGNDVPLDLRDVDVVWDLIGLDPAAAVELFVNTTERLLGTSQIQASKRRA